MSEKNYSYNYEINDDETGAFVRIEVEVFASSKRSAVSRIAKAIAAVAKGMDKEEIAEYVEVEE